MSRLERREEVLHVRSHRTELIEGRVHLERGDAEGQSFAGVKVSGIAEVCLECMHECVEKLVEIGVRG